MHVCHCQDGAFPRRGLERGCPGGGCSCVDSLMCHLQLQEMHSVKPPSSTCSCRANTTQPPALWTPGTPTRRRTPKVSLAPPDLPRVLLLEGDALPNCGDLEIFNPDHLKFLWRNLLNLSCCQYRLLKHHLCCIVDSFLEINFI